MVQRWNGMLGLCNIIKLTEWQKFNSSIGLCVQMMQMNSFLYSKELHLVYYIFRL
jgi:hypothetical protein